jgi:hypothetical protein
MARPASGGVDYGQVSDIADYSAPATGVGFSQYSTDQYVGQVQDMGNRFIYFLNWLRAKTVPFTRPIQTGGFPDQGYVGPPATNDYLPTVPLSGPQLQNDPQYPRATPHLWFNPHALVLGGTSTQSPPGATTGLVSQNLQPEVPETDPWLLSAHGYYEGRSVAG